jgi:uncharacterized RDD family membrane protein YckC
MEPIGSIQIASLFRRFVAFLIDVLPITAAIYLFFYFTTDFKDIFDKYFSETRDLENARQFLIERNKIRDLTGLVYVLYAALLEGSFVEGTIGKRILGIRVVGRDGSKIGFLRAFSRNFAKIFSILPVFLGCIAAIRSNTRQAWHDKIAKTFVVRLDPALGESVIIKAVKVMLVIGLVCGVFAFLSK